MTDLRCERCRQPAPKPVWRYHRVGYIRGEPVGVREPYCSLECAEKDDAEALEGTGQ